MSLKEHILWPPAIEPEEDISKARARLDARYSQVFTTKDGEFVLADLWRAVGMNRMPKPDSPQVAAFKNGAMSVVHYILGRIEADLTGVHEKPQITAQEERPING